MFIQVEPVRASVLDVLVCCVDMVLNTEWVQIEAIDLTSDGSAWGFGITGGRSTGVVVKTIVPGSVADKDGRLQIGDHIIQIGDINLRGMGSEQVAMVLRQCGSQVHLIVARPVEPSSPEDALMQSNSAIIPTRVLNEPEELEQQLNVYQPGSNGFSDPVLPDLYCNDSTGLVNMQRDSLSFKKRTDRVEMESFEVNLVKDHQGLGIIVAGYVCEREDISGIFIKSIAKGSVADLCGQIRVHDQVVEVDGHPLKGYSNCEAVEILRNTGKYVKLQLARYHHGSKFEHLQEAMGSEKIHSIHDYCNTSRRSLSNQIPDNAYTITNVEEVKSKWKSVLSPKCEVIITELQKNDNEIGFGFNVETRCDSKSVLHHFISDICKGYSVDRSGAVFIGDELLEVNGEKIQGTKYSEVLSIFKALPPNIVLVCGRSHHWTSNLSLVPWSDRLVKAKSDSYLLTRKRCESNVKNFNRRSLELLSSLATWSSEPHFIDLVKGEEGLGFSIMEYKDNLMPCIQDENVIIVWSLVPGAAAQLDGRLLPGDRLLSVNNINFRHTNFDMALEVLKHVPKGVVRLGVAKPTTLSKSVPAKISFKEPIEEKNVFSNGTALRVFEYNGVCHTYEEPNNMYTRSQTPSSLFSFGNDSRCSTPFSSPGLSSSGRLWAFEIPILPAALERIVKIRKGNNKLGLVLDIADRGQNGMIVKSIRPASAVEKDGSVQVGDYILGVNSENMRNITRSQARAIIRRAELTSSDIVIKYIPAADAAVHQQSAVLAKIHEGSVSPTPSIISRQPSPRVFPAYYRSPYFPHKSSKSTPDHEDGDGQVSPFSFLSEDDILATPSSLYTDNFDSSSDDLLLDTPIDSGMKNNSEAEPFPSVEDRILLFQGSKHQVPSKFSRMSTSPTISPVQDESPQQQKSPELPETPESLREFPVTSPATNSGISSPLLNSAGCQWGVNRTIELWREPGQEIGIGVVMGCIDAEDDDGSPLSGIFIKHVVTDSIAGRDGTINRGDRIVAVNGIDLQDASYKEAIETIQNCENPIKLTVQSLVPWFPSNNNETAQTPPPEPETSPHPAAASEAATSFHEEKMRQRSMSEEDDDMMDDFQGKVYTAKGVEIDRASAGYVKLYEEDTEEEDDYGYTQKKIKKKYGEMKGTVHLVQIEKGANGLGISLAGNRNRSKMSSFICGMHPHGNAFKTNKIEVGDEILEVNGMVLYNRCHLNVSAIIRGIMNPVCKLILLRKETSADEMAVKPITHFPVDIENEKMEDIISSHPGVRTVVTRKGDLGLGIMILEGKHVELGRGIFISDIQKDSPADKNGLCVGDMILAVNKTKLIGADYELAASVLKNEDGPMTFLVVNSQKPASSPMHNDAEHNKGPRSSLTPFPEGGDRRSSLSPTCPSPNRNSPSLPACPIPPPAEFSDSTVILDTVGTEIVADIHRDKTGLGLGIVGGSDTPIGSIIIHEIYASGAVAKDGKLKPGDQILEVNGHDLRHASHLEAINVLRHSVPNVQIRVYRHNKEMKENLAMVELNVELVKKPGRGLGLSIVGLNNSRGVYISEIIKGGVADLDGSLMEGDQILEVNGQNLRESSQEAAAVLLKTAVGKINMKIGRLKCEVKVPPKRSMH